MKNKFKISVVGVIIVVLYLVVTFYFVSDILTFNSRANKYRYDYVENLESRLSKIVKDSNDENLVVELDELYNEYSVEIVVDNGTSTIFNSIPHNVGDKHYNTLNQKAVLVDSSGSIETKFGTRNVWYIIYQIANNEIYENYFNQQLLLIGSGFVLLSVLTIYLSKTLLTPLKKIKNAIESASEFQFDEVEGGHDAINEAFFEFTEKLEYGIDAVSRNYSQLEKQLQIEKERLNNTLTVARLFIHDFKTPLHQLILENSFYLKENSDVSEETKKVISINNTVIDKMTLSVNDVLKLMSDDVYTRVKELELVSLELVVFQSLNTHQRQIKDKKIRIEVIVDNFSEILINKPTVSLLMHNLTSNLVQYSNEKSVALIELVDKDSFIELRYSNQSSNKNIKRMIDSEKIFNAVVAPNKEGYVYSSGNGLFLIRDLTAMLNGEYRIENEGSQVSIIITLPKGVENNA